MEDKLLDLIRELCEEDDGSDLDGSSQVDEYLDEIALDELSMAIEEEFGVIIDPSDMEDISIDKLCSDKQNKAQALMLPVGSLRACRRTKQAPRLPGLKTSGEIHT